MKLGLGLHDWKISGFSNWVKITCLLVMLSLHLWLWRLETLSYPWRTLQIGSRWLRTFNKISLHWMEWWGGNLGSGILYVEGCMPWLWTGIFWKSVLCTLRLAQGPSWEKREALKKVLRGQGGHRGGKVEWPSGARRDTGVTRPCQAKSVWTPCCHLRVNCSDVVEQIKSFIQRISTT